VAPELLQERLTKLLDSYAMCAREIVRHGGVLVKQTGDGMLARFDSPGRAASCALAINAVVGALGLRQRAGVHTGEVELRGHDLGGIAVHLASRVMSVAQPGEVLVSCTVKDLTIGTALVFEDRGEHTLVGVPGSWVLYAVT
jgi:class 3 adenylate cyclase